MRRAIPLLAALTALSAASPAVAHPRVRPGTIPVVSNRVRVVVTLPAPPLALRGARGLATAVARAKLDTTTTTARAYVRRLQRAQARAAARLRAAIPQAHVGRRFQVVLDGLTVTLPATKLPTLMRQRWLAHVYPSLQYSLATDHSPSVIGADQLRAATGADGSGMKIAVVDDGIDQTNAFFLPSAFGPVPAGFPKGDTAYTTAKVIVARVFPGPNAGRAGRLPVDPASSFHGTHVAGIAAGVAGTTAPAGSDHPRTTGLSGVAPRAWLGNYRVFTVPTPIGHVANTPEIIAAFEAAVKDGMDVVNFSGGGAEVEPANDALIAALHAVAAAGVVPVIAAGNDRDDFGVGTVGSPGTAPDAISVAAVSNTHVFAPELAVTAAGGPKGVPFVRAPGGTPEDWSTTPQALVDVGAVTGTNGKPVERHLCGPAGALDVPRGTLPAASLRGAIALVTRGLCPLEEKAEQARAAGAIGIVLADNREGEANSLPGRLAVPGGMIANLDGQRLVDFMAARGGRTTITVGRETRELETGRSGVLTSFSSAGPTAFGHRLKPDVAAPGGQILSATLANTDPSRFGVFDGTSMATPHVAGAAALLLQLHRSWTPAQVKSALMSTAAPAWGDTARTREAPVPLEGAGLVALARANDPAIFTAPVSLSFGNVAANATATQLVTISDAGGGAGTWTAETQVQATTGGTVSTGGLVLVPPGGSAQLTVSIAAGAATGENYGFVVLRKGSVTRRVPYLYFDTSPALAAASERALQRVQRGQTKTGPNRVTSYRYPSAPFGNQPDAPAMIEDGAEVVYTTQLRGGLVNAGVSLATESAGARIDPWYLGAKDESTVQGFAGTPVDVNELTYDYKQDVGAAGAAFPAGGRYYVAVDSGRGRFDGKRLAGSYTLRAWTNDVTPPTLRLLTTRVTAGRPTLVFRTTDRQSGVDPASLTVGYRGQLIAVGTFQRATGLAVFPLPASVPALAAGRFRLSMLSSDFQETKNVDTKGTAIMPNTRTRASFVRVVPGPTVSWLLPEPGLCSGRRLLEVAAGSTARVRVVRFTVDGRLVASDRSGSNGLWAAEARLAGGKHVLAATVVDAKGRTASARQVIRACRA